MTKPAISIKPSHRGELHRDLGVPQGEPISMADLMKAKKSSSPATRRRATFAAAARSWK